MGADDLDRVAGLQRRGRPFGARHDLVVDGDGDTRLTLVDGLGRQQLDQAGAVEAVGGAVQADIHVFFLVVSSRAKRASPNAAMVGSVSPVSTNLAMASAVAGVSKMPLR